MTAYDVIKLLSFPEKALADKKVFKRAFYENAGLSKQQEELIRNDINEVRWYYALKQENINIPGFKNDDVDYQEIQVIGVVLKDDKYAYNIAEIIQKAIQYPIILVVECKEKVFLNVAYKRINKADISKSVVDKIYNSGWIAEKNNKEDNFFKSINIKELSFLNFYEFYGDFADRVKLFCVCEYKTDYVYQSKSNTAMLYQLCQQIKSLKDQKTALQRQIRAETDFAKKLKLNIEVKNIESCIDHSIRQIRT